MNLVYSPTPKVDRVDWYHGVPVPDPYGWLEDVESATVEEWINAQNALTKSYLSQLPHRESLRRRFQELLSYPRYYDLVERDGYLLFKRNDGLQPQLLVYVERSGEAPEVLIDPRHDAPDGTTRVVAVTPSRDGRYVGYGLSRGGSDWQEYHIRDMVTGRDLPDLLKWAKVSMMAWYQDGFYYSRYPEAGANAQSFSTRNEHHQVWYHRVGQPQSADTLIYEDPAYPLRHHIVETTEDERFTILNVFDSAGGYSGRALWILQPGGHPADPIPLVTTFDDDWRIVDNDGDKLLVLTTRGAPNWRVVLIDPSCPDQQHWEEIVPETDQPLEFVIPGADRLFAVYRKDAANRLVIYDRRGRLENEVALPGPGTVRVFPGRRKDAHAYWSFASFTTPTTIYRYDSVLHRSTTVHKGALPFEADRYVARQVFYPSKDGTSIPMFVVHGKDLELDGQHALLLEGYGGNRMSVGPSFDPLLLALLERGVVYASMCLRGGGEYGEEWHEAGSRDKKQNVFDDCIAAAEWLQAQGYTTRGRVALAGASNGGLLVGAVITQRPDLFKVALPSGGVMDMLRFQRFTIASAWTAEYGSSDDPEMFPILLGYSPLHNIKEGVSYPATLATTSRYDDRVVPLHSYKFIATLQEKGTGPNPYLIRIDHTSGHGPVSLPQLLDERADQYAFLLAHTQGEAMGLPYSRVTVAASAK